MLLSVNGQVGRPCGGREMLHERHVQDSGPIGVDAEAGVAYLDAVRQSLPVVDHAHGPADVVEPLRVGGGRVAAAAVQRPTGIGAEPVGE